MTKIKINLGGDRECDTPVFKKCETCEEARYWSEVWGDMEDYCPYCEKTVPIYYKRNGAFISNHCQVCHGDFSEGVSTPHETYSA